MNHDANNNSIIQALPNEDTDKDGIVTWEEYVTNTFGAQYLNKEAGKEAGKDDDDDSETYAKLVCCIFRNLCSI